MREWSMFGGRASARERRGNERRGWPGGAERRGWRGPSERQPSRARRFFLRSERMRVRGCGCSRARPLRRRHRRHRPGRCFRLSSSASPATRTGWRIASLTLALLAGAHVVDPRQDAGLVFGRQGVGHREWHGGSARRRLTGDLVDQEAVVSADVGAAAA